MSRRPISEQYAAAVDSFIELARTLTDDDWSTPAPCTPLWTVRDVLSHVSGVTDDALSGRLDGVATEAWTASQVERNRGATVDELLERWAAQRDAFGEAIEAMGEERPPYDCHTHEHDVRNAIGRPGNRESTIIAEAFDRFGEFLTTDLFPVALDIVTERGATQSLGDRSSDRRVGLVTTEFEVFRSRLGRRSRQQVLDYDWTGEATDVEAVVDRWFNFGPSVADILE